MVGSTYKSYFVKFEGDTTINGLPYKKILQSFDELQANWSSSDYIREETTTRKVFIYNKTVNKDILLYDFSLEEGDSILTSDGHSYAKVTKVVNEVFGNSQVIRKQIYFFDTSGTTRWIEGIGSTWGILEGLNSFYTTGATARLVCYYENDGWVYHNPHFFTCFAKGYYNNTEERTQQTTAVSIAYQTGQVILSFTEIGGSNSMLQLYNLTGEKIMQSTLKGKSHFVISTLNLLPGLYIYRYTNKGINATGKILVKQGLKY